MTEKSRYGLRLMLATGTCLAVTLIATVVAWQTTRPMYNVRHQQWITQQMLEELPRAIAKYQQLTNALPQTLDDLRVLGQLHWLYFDEKQGLVDGWKRAFVYVHAGTNYTVSSLGRDGRLGGVGLDYDLTAADPNPGIAMPTFGQFLGNSPANRGMVVTCIMSGILAFGLCWCLTRPPQLARQKAVFLALKLIATIIGAAIVGALLAIVHIPSGH